MTDTTIINTVVPAEPGWKLARFFERDKECEPCFWLSDIIAWRIEIIACAGRPDEHTVTPITVDGCNVGSVTGHWALRRPDGEYLWCGEDELGSEEQALARFQKMTDYDRERKQKTA